MWPVLIADPGSTWCGKKEYAHRLIEMAKDAGFTAIKFQLFAGEEYRKAGNIELPHDLFRELYEYGKNVGIPVTASAFNEQSLSLLLSLKVHHVKFAYSQRRELNRIQRVVDAGIKCVVTGHIMDGITYPEPVIRLYTASDSYGPLYPCLFQNDFENLFHGRFDGFSDHTLGYTQTRAAVKAGATWVEKHITLGEEDALATPDGRFALKPNELHEFVFRVRS